MQPMKLKRDYRRKRLPSKEKAFYKEGDEELYEILAPEFEADDIRSVLFESRHNLILYKEEGHEDHRSFNQWRRRSRHECCY